jgi:hypothetical protein
MLQKILATSVLVTLLASATFVQAESVSGPGKASPVTVEASEELMLNSASDAPSDFVTLSEVTITPEMNEAIFSFSTDISTHAVIEYGLTREYDRSISTEPQKIHTETIGDLTSCARYYYRVHVGDESQEGDFNTLCPVAAKKPIPKPTIKKKVAVVPVVVPEPVAEPTPVVAEEELVLNAAPEEDNSVTVEVVEAPQSPVLPGPIAFGNDTISDEEKDTTNSIPVGLLLFALASGMVVMLFTFKKKKKWYQK